MHIRAALFALSLALPVFAQPGEPIAQPGTQPANPPIIIRNVEYTKLATREETERRMLDLLSPSRAKWGTWYGMGSFEGGIGSIKNAKPPEDELKNMAAGGPGPDLKAEYTAKGGAKAGWKPLGSKVGEVVNFLAFTPNNLQSNVTGYIYTTVTADKAMTLDVTMGSDDGLRFWLNGRLLLDADGPNSLDPERHQLRLDLKKGVNHVFVKVTQGQVGWEYQLNAGAVLDPSTRQLLDYHLDVDFPPTAEAEYYRSFPILLPPSVVLEAGGVDVMPDGRPIVSTRRGDVYIIGNAYAEPPLECTFVRYAEGLHEPLGLRVRKEQFEGREVVAVYCVQRGELTRMIDLDGDDRADLFQTVTDGWGVSGNYHEFAFGPKFGPDGKAWITLNVGFCDALGKSIVPWRGWSLTTDVNDPSGKLEPISSGLRSPNGIGFWSDGQAFYLDNQGDYVGTNRLAPMYKGGWNGHPAGLRWREDYTKEMDNPKNYPKLTPAAVWFPYRKMGQSSADFVMSTPADGATPGTFGPFDGQGWVGDQTLCMVMRVTLEKINGVYQGACYPFRSGLQCGVNRLAWGKDGSLFVGQTDRGWGSIGRARYGLERIKFTGKVPFEMKEIKVRKDGFEVEFTADVDPKTAGDATSYSCVSYTYEYHAKYGSDEMETKKPGVTKAEVIGPRTVRLTIDGMRAGGTGYVHEITGLGVRDKSGAAMLHTTAYYTVQVLPE
jgi:hypothetical protein